MPGITDNSLNWLLDDMVQRVPGVQQAIVLSTDGLLIGRSSNVAQEDAEHLSAVASGAPEPGPRRRPALQRRRRAADPRRDGRTRSSSSPRRRTGACLAVLADSGADLGLLAYEMNLLVRRVGSTLGTKPRSRVGPHGAGRGD